ncbi:MAG: 4-hydroxy-tetrahydrodipicolinate synthase [Gammaproteobacteria bacterium]
MQNIQGSIVALVTPMHPDGSVDFDALKFLVEWHIKEGTQGIVSVGTTGESATLNNDEHIEVIKKTLEYSQNKLPIIAGTGANSTQEAIDLTKEAANLGCKFSLQVTPYYNKPPQNGMKKHFISIAEASDAKILLYNVPGRTSCDLLPSTVAELIQHPNIIGIKEALADSSRIKELVSLRNKINPDFVLLSGDDHTFCSAMEEGFNGVISVAANIIPGACSKIASLALAHQFQEAAQLNKKYEFLYDLLFCQSNPIPAKWMLEKMKFIKSGIRLPLIELDPMYHNEVESVLKTLSLINEYR